MKRLKKKSNIDKNIPLENKLKQLNDIGQHKTYVLKCSTALANYLMENNREQDALNVMKRAFEHDFSKLTDEEFYGMAKFVNEMQVTTDSNSGSEEKEYYIDLHRNNNKHHPEYWTNINDMTELDIMELACDWCSRSVQFNTDIIEFLEDVQETRFHFPEGIYNNIKKYLLIITEEVKKER